MWDAVIAGAGPAGAIAAYELARHGRRVLLADGIDPPSPKIGEALPGAAVRLLRSIELPVPAAGGPHTPIGGTLSFWNFEQLVHNDFLRDPDGPGWRLDRARFDADVRAAALSAGASYRSARVADLERSNTGWHIRFGNGGTETARWVVDATGRRAAIARRLGASRLRDAPLVAIYASGTSATGFALNRTVIEAVPQGWWYAARLPSGVALAGYHTHRRDAARLVAEPGSWRKALADTRHVGPMLADTQFEHPRSLEAAGGWLDRFSGDGWIACGDAALSFDPISGQGIFSALYGGMTAGRAIDEALNGNNAKLQEYSNRLENIRRVYVARCHAVYHSERRWTTEPFWSIFGGVNELPPVKDSQASCRLA